MTKDRTIHSIRDPCGESLIPYLPDRRFLVQSSVKESDQFWLPGVNYRPCSRYKRLLHDFCIPIEKPKMVTTKCITCDGPMKLKIFPSNKKKQKIIVDEVWGVKGQPENPKIQQLFETWLTSNNNNCATEVETKPSKFRKPHHYYHHNLIKTKETPVPMEKFLFCAGCPDRYRSWIRNAKPDHYFERMLKFTRKGKKEHELQNTSKQELEDPSELLKEALSLILERECIPSILVSL